MVENSVLGPSPLAYWHKWISGPKEFNCKRRSKTDHCPNSQLVLAHASVSLCFYCHKSELNSSFNDFFPILGKFDRANSFKYSSLKKFCEFSYSDMWKPPQFFHQHFVISLCKNSSSQISIYEKVSLDRAVRIVIFIPWPCGLKTEEKLSTRQKLSTRCNRVV